jgi:hypothetical protein
MCYTFRIDKNKNTINRRISTKNLHIPAKKNFSKVFPLPCP